MAPSPNPFDPAAALSDAVNQGEQRLGNAGLFMLALLVGVGVLVYSAGPEVNWTLF